MKYLRLVWEGIWRKPGRTTLTLLQVIVAFLLFGLLQGMKSGIDDSIDKLRGIVEVARHTLDRLDSFIDAVAGKHITCKQLTQEMV